MTITSRELLANFEALEPAEKQEVASEILRRAIGRDGIEDTAFVDLGAAIFQGYDQEESRRAQP